MSQASSPITAKRVAWYYDHNTPRFLSLGGSGSAAAIHRQIWAPGVQDAKEAFTYIHRWTAKAMAPALENSGEGHVLDLGCGVGGSATWMAGNLGIKVSGITNSRVQQRMAAQRAKDMGLEERCRFILADFMNLPHLEPAGAAFAIESFVHAPDPARFFEAAAVALAPAGRLVICDDFLNPAPFQGSAQARDVWLERFCQGWHINSLLTVSEVEGLANAVGLRLIQEEDLTPHLRLFGRLKLFVMNALTKLPIRSAYWHNLAGGAALQVCLRSRWTGYHALAFEKAAA